MRSLVDQLLDLSRLEADTVPIQPTRITVRAEIEDLVSASASGREDEVEIKIPDDLEALVDKTVFERVVSNLLTNALRHGSSPVVVTAAQSDNHFRLIVEDRGEGVPPMFTKDLFERFSRSDEARAHGGDLVHEHVKPHGARFELIVPVGRGRNGGRDN